MKRSIKLAIAGAVCGVIFTSAYAEDMVEARKRIEVSTTADMVWEKIGDFCAIADWHDAVVTCEISKEDGDTYRTLTLGDGAVLKEKHLGAGKTETSYRYQIVEGPLPVKDYVSEFAVSVDDDGGAGIKWSSEFAADGVSPDEAIALIQGIYDSGMGSIEAMF